jgi:hypothetical protein
MTAQSTLGDPKKLADLIFALEQGKNPLRLTLSFPDNAIDIVAVSSSDYPEMRNLFVIPEHVTNRMLYNREYRDYWVRELIRSLDEIPELGRDSVLFLTILCPGSEPKGIAHFTQMRVKVRLLSAFEHLWRDRLRIEDPEQRNELRGTCYYPSAGR